MSGVSPSNVVRWAGIAVGLAGLIFLLSGREHVGNDGFKGKASLNSSNKKIAGPIRESLFLNLGSGSLPASDLVKTVVAAETFLANLTHNREEGRAKAVSGFARCPRLPRLRVGRGRPEPG